MSEPIKIRASGGAWQAQNGLILVEFEHSLGTYWLEYVPEGGKFKKAIQDGMLQFANELGETPQFAFVNPLPAGAQEYMDIVDGHGNAVSLLVADWVQPRFVVLGRGGMELIREALQHWKRGKA